MFLESLELKNFRIHKYLKINFENITAIIGDSGKGKSTIFQALKVVIHNKPRKLKRLVHPGKNDFKIKIKTKDFIIIRNIRKYILIDKKTKEREVFKAFGSNVPEPIQRILNIKEINWQNQHDPHYLVFQGGGAASKILEKSFDNTDAKNLIEKAKEKISKLKSNYKIKLSIKEEAEKTIKRLDSLKNLEPLIKKIKSIQSKKEVLEEEIENLLYITGTLKNLKILPENKVSNIQELILEANKLNKKRKTTDFEIEELSDSIKKIKSTKIIEEKSILKISKNFVRANSTFENLKNLKIEISNIEEYTYTLQNIKDYSKEIKKLQKEFDNEMKKIGYCPLCKRRV